MNHNAWSSIQNKFEMKMYKKLFDTVKKWIETGIWNGFNPLISSFWIFQPMMPIGWAEVSKKNRLYEWQTYFD